jgi:hypothetical protein
MENVLSWLGCLIMCLGYIPYWITIIRKERPGRKKTTPTISSWVIWAALDTVLIVSMISEGTLTGQMIGATVGSTLTLFITLRYGEMKWKKFDLYCLAGGGIGILFWVLLNDPAACIIINLIVVSAAGLRTMISAWGDPYSENLPGWTLWFLACLPALAAEMIAPHWGWMDIAQPATFLATESTMVIILILRRPPLPQTVA